MTRHSICLTIISILLMLTSCGHKQNYNPQPVEVITDPDSLAAIWADSVMKTLSLEDRVGQLFMPSAYAEDDSYNMRHLQRYVADYHVGGILFLKGNAVSLAAAIDTLQSLANVPLFMALDAEWGLGMRLQDAPRFPMQGEIGDNVGDSIMYLYGSEMAREAKLVGLNMLMGPVMDVLTNPNNHAIGKRAISNDPQRVASLATAYARGMEDGNVLSIAKHFPGHGATSTDSHLTLPQVNTSKAGLDSIDLLPFRRYISDNLSGIMVGHLYMPALDSIQRSAALSPEIITGLLIEKLKFNGLILTDAVNMKGAGNDTQLSVEALKAGADIILSPADTQAEIEAVCNAVNRGEISRQAIDAKCRKVLKYKYRFARNHHPVQNHTNLLRNIYSPEATKLRTLLHQ